MNRYGKTEYNGESAVNLLQDGVSQNHELLRSLDMLMSSCRGPVWQRVQDGRVSSPLPYQRRGRWPRPGRSHSYVPFLPIARPMPAHTVHTHNASPQTLR